VLKEGNNTSITLILNTVVPQECVLSPLLYSLFTHDCGHARLQLNHQVCRLHNSSLITNNDKTAYREEVRALSEWCQGNNLSLNINKMKALIMDFRKQQREHAPIHIDGTSVENVESFKFLCILITDNLKWSTHKAKKIIKGINHPSHGLFTSQSSRRRGQYRCIKAGAERLKKSPVTQPCTLEAAVLYT
jgi:hypothetical protein